MKKGEAGNFFNQDFDRLETEDDDRKPISLSSKKDKNDPLLNEIEHVGLENLRRLKGEGEGNEKLQTTFPSATEVFVGDEKGELDISSPLMEIDSKNPKYEKVLDCLLYTSDAADE
jgi:hypothetical protein